MDFVDDTYNANPASTRRALETFAKLPTQGKRFFVLGDMLELGEEGSAFHAAIGELVVSLGIDGFVALGPLSHQAYARACACGMNGMQGAAAESIEAAAEWLAQRARPGDRILVKGSRGMHTEDVIGKFEALAAPHSH
ncbi:MAG: cyanophycin synthetase [Candidatus Omnitrophota bacterium]